MPTPPSSWKSWEDVMRSATAQAEKAAALGEVPVGAVILDPDGRIVGTGHNAPIAKCDPTAHAEISALRQAATAMGNYRLNGCVMAVTLEPCLMCVGALVHARITGVIFGAYDARAGAVSSRIDGFELPLHNHLPWQAGGVLASECSALLQNFFSNCRVPKP